MEEIYIKEENLSIAWAKAFLNTINISGGEISPLMVKVTGFHNGIPIEDLRIRDIINNHSILKRKYKISKDYIETVAGTIFPQTQWNPKKDRDTLYSRYRKIYPMMKKVQGNRLGIYFHRLIDFDNGSKEPINQLEKIIEAWEVNNHRRSALQASIFDPRKDHKVKHKRPGFPCLQQVNLSPLGTNGSKGLRIVGFYAKQLIFEKAYGNYLGLCRLGHFMATALNLELKEMVCIASVAGYGQPTKSSLESLKKKLLKIIK